MGKHIAEKLLMERQEYIEIYKEQIQELSECFEIPYKEMKKLKPQI